MKQESKPLVLLDVDGVINSLYALYEGKGHDVEGYEKFQASNGTDGVYSSKQTYWIYVHPRTKELVQELVKVADVWWCTTWRHWANDDIRAHLEIPELPVITDGNFGHSVNFKWNAAAPVVEEAHAAGRKVLWIEDFEESHIPHRNNDPTWRDVAFLDTAETGFELMDLPMELWEWLLE